MKKFVFNGQLYSEFDLEQLLQLQLDRLQEIFEEFYLNAGVIGRKVYRFRTTRYKNIVLKKLEAKKDLLFKAILNGRPLTVGAVPFVVVVPPSRYFLNIERLCKSCNFRDRSREATGARGASCAYHVSESLSARYGYPRLPYFLVDVNLGFCQGHPSDGKAEQVFREMVVKAQEDHRFGLDSMELLSLVAHTQPFVVDPDWSVSDPFSEREKMNQYEPSARYHAIGSLYGRMKTEKDVGLALVRHHNSIRPVLQTGVYFPRSAAIGTIYKEFYPTYRERI